MSDIIKPATTLNDIFQNLSQEPLRDDSQFIAFYEPSVNLVRGVDKVDRMRFQLQHAYRSAFYHAFLHGHLGVGKSTELERLRRDVRSQFCTVRFSALEDLNPAGYQPFDVLYVMLIKLLQETKEQTNHELPPHLLKKIAEWFSTRTKTYKQTVHMDAGASAGAGPKSGSALETLLGLFGNVSGAIKYTSDRETTTTEYELSLIPELVRLINELLGECSRMLRENDGREWLFVGEDFDKVLGKPELARDLFVSYGAVFQDLQVHTIFNVPVELVYSNLGGRLKATGGHIYGILDTPVFDQEHLPDLSGREAIRKVLDRRLSPGLFENDQQERLIVASGGNLRDLFAGVEEAAINASLRYDGNGKIGSADVDIAINGLRSEYLRFLGQVFMISLRPRRFLMKRKRAVCLMSMELLALPRSAMPSCTTYSALVPFRNSTARPGMVFIRWW